MDIPDSGLLPAADGIDRCFWGASPPIYVEYHDREWGRPQADDVRLFEKICLEGFQSGLSWLTILKKRENFRAAFAGFDFERVARFDDDDLARLLGDAGIVRHRGKIRSTINNAQKACDLVDDVGSLAAFFWRYEPAATERPARMDWPSLRAMPTTPTSKRLAKDLKKRGWSFVGPTTAYAFMQAMGLVNDHMEGCPIRAEVEAERASFERP